MSTGKIIINGHFRPQRVAGVQRYAWEIISQFDKQNVPYSWVQPPRRLRSDMARHLWMQSIMPFKIPDQSVLWSPTNIGPVFCKNQVVTLHDIADQLYPEWFDDKYVAWRRFILPKLLKRVRKIITVSKYSRQTILEYFPQVEGKIAVIYNGVRTDHFYPRHGNEIEGIRRTFDLKKPFVLSVGSLDPRKNIHGLIKAWHMLPDWIHKEMNLVITGESARKFAFTIDGNYDESIRFTGYVKEKQLPVLYSAAQTFVYPSLFEGFGLPVLEAMACGTSVVTSETTSLKELAKDKALTVDPHEPDAIAEAIKKMIDSNALRSQYADEGQHYAKTFGWDKTAGELSKILRRYID